MEIIKAFWYRGKEVNIGDTLTPIILEHFTGKKVEWIDGHTKGKLMAVGSIMRLLQPGDKVWGTGIMRSTDAFFQAPDCKFLAVRGRLSRDILIQYGAKVPEVFGDPALLLPLIYNPQGIEKKYEMGWIPHYIEKNDGMKYDDDVLKIDVAWPLQKFVDAVLSCKMIVSSSLHGLIIAEAYGIKAVWEYSSKVLGNGFKFADYLTGTGRQPMFGGGDFEPIKNLAEIQEKLLEALKKCYGNSR